MPQAWKQVQQAFTGDEWWKLVLVVLLMLVNWGIEAKKWQYQVSAIQKVPFLKAYRAIFTGQAIALNTFNGVGEYVGRVVYLDDGNRLRAVALSIVGSLSQVIVTMVMGVIALLYVRIDVLNATTQLEGLSFFWLNGLIYMLIFWTLVFLVFYFNLSLLTKLAERIPFVAKYAFYIQKLEDFHWRQLTRILGFSFLRYVVFVLQYLLLLQFFNVEAPWWQLAAMVCVLFLVLAVVPTIPVAELGLRGQASKQLFGLLSVNSLGIVFTAVGIWAINRVLPAIAGTLFILGLKFFKGSPKGDDSLDEIKP